MRFVGEQSGAAGDLQRPVAAGAAGQRRGALCQFPRRRPQAGKAVGRRSVLRRSLRRGHARSGDAKRRPDGCEAFDAVRGVLKTSLRSSPAAGQAAVPASCPRGQRAGEAGLWKRQEGSGGKGRRLGADELGQPAQGRLGFGQARIGLEQMAHAVIDFHAHIDLASAARSPSREASSRSTSFDPACTITGENPSSWRTGARHRHRRGWTCAGNAGRRQTGTPVQQKIALAVAQHRPADSDRRPRATAPGCRPAAPGRHSSPPAPRRRPARLPASSPPSTMKDPATPLASRAR